MALEARSCHSFSLDCQLTSMVGFLPPVLHRCLTLCRDKTPEQVGRKVWDCQAGAAGSHTAPPPHLPCPPSPLQQTGDFRMNRKVEPLPFESLLLRVLWQGGACSYLGASRIPIFSLNLASLRQLLPPDPTPTWLFLLASVFPSLLLLETQPFFLFPLL